MRDVWIRASILLERVEVGLSAVDRRQTLLNHRPHQPWDTNIQSGPAMAQSDLMIGPRSANGSCLHSRMHAAHGPGSQ